MQHEVFPGGHPSYYTLPQSHLTAEL